MTGPQLIDLGNPVADHQLNKGLVSWWYPLRNRMGNAVLFDLAGGRHGTMVNTPAWTTGPMAGGKPTASLQFNGSSQYLSATNLTDLSGSGTICWWMRPGAAYNDGTIHGIFGQNDGAGHYFDGQKYSDGNFYFGWNGAAGDQRVVVSAAAVYPLNAWGHYTLTWSSGGASTLYFNGLSVASNGGTTSTLNLASPFAWAKQGPVNTYFSGQMTDLRYYARSLSAGNAMDLFDQSERGHPDTLRRWTARTWIAVTPPASPPPPPTPVFTAVSGFGW